jgi:hypothetical protein
MSEDSEKAKVLLKRMVPDPREYRLVFRRCHLDELDREDLYRVFVYLNLLRRRKEAVHKKEIEVYERLLNLERI